jgi:hypothetical protein
MPAVPVPIAPQFRVEEEIRSFPPLADSSDG